jgi:hypothetical protein
MSFLSLSFRGNEKNIHSIRGQIPHHRKMSACINVLATLGEDLDTVEDTVKDAERALHHAQFNVYIAQSRLADAHHRVYETREEIAATEVEMRNTESNND